jgi:hypothetical protein
MSEDLRTESGQVINSEQLAVQGGGGAAGTLTENPAPVAAAVRQLFQQAVTVGASGTVTWQASMNVQKGAGTAALGDNILFSVTVNGVNTGASALVELSPTKGQAAATLFGQKGGLAPGSVVNVGIQANDQTTPADTIELGSQGVASVLASSV